LIIIFEVNKDLGSNLTEIFPSSLIASMIGISSYPFFEASEAAKQEINAADYLKK